MLISRKLLTYLLYGLPVVFFGVCYFLMTVWGEDIIQGANTTPDVWNDIIGAFQHNSRLSDMYAWAVINFFDFQYSFGVDTIFRLIDVAMASGIIYLLTMMILERRPRLKLGDAMIFGLGFLVICLTPEGYTLYRGFSVIHNYLIISLTGLVFALPFLRAVAGKEIPQIYRKWWFALGVGLAFGMASNITPVAFLIAFVGAKMIEGMREKDRKGVWKLPKWQIMMLVGMGITLAVAYVFGAGVSTYANNPVYVETYDYLSLGEIFDNPGGAMVRIVKHLAVNFGCVWLPIGGAGVILAGMMLVAGKLTGRKVKLWPQTRMQRQALGAAVGFATVYLLCSTQIKLPIRLGSPAYLGMVIGLGILVWGWWQQLAVAKTKMGGLQQRRMERSAVSLAAAMSIVMLAMIGVRGYFALEYRPRIGQALSEVERAEGEVACVNPAQLRPKKLPLVFFSQDETFAEWALPYMTVYGKKVVVCKP